MEQSAAVAAAAGSDAIRAITEGRLRDAAVAIDRDAAYPRDIMHDLGAAGAFAQLADGHAGLTTKVSLIPTIEAVAAVARQCGATAFCCWCQGALTWYLRCTTNKSLRERLLADVASGTTLGGTALSNPMKAVSGLEDLLLKSRLAESGSGWRVSGVIPWVSNIETGSPFGAIFAVPDAPPVMAVVDDTLDDLVLRTNDNFEVMAGTATVSVSLRKVAVDPAQVLAEDANDFIAKIRPGFVLIQAGIGLGLLEAAAAVMDKSRRTPSAGLGLAQGLLTTAQQVRAKIVTLRERVHAQAEVVALDAGPTAAETMALRLDLATATFQAAIAAQLMAGAPGLIRGMRAGRLIREAAFYGVLTPSVRHLNYMLAQAAQT